MASTKSKPTLEKIAKAILPERPLYILRASKIPQEFRPVGTLALAGRHLDLTLQDYIPKWRGRRNLILLNDLEIGDYTHAMYHAGPRRIYKRRETLMVLAHELSHVAARPILESEKDDNLDPAFSKAVTASLVDFCKDTPSAAAALTSGFHEPVGLIPSNTAYRRVKMSTEPRWATNPSDWPTYR